MEESPSLPTLQPEILLRIFHKLAIRSVHQCKLVCKEWNSLISDPFFRSNYKPILIPNHPLNLMMIPSSTSYKRDRTKNLSAVSYEIDGSTTPLTSRPQPLPSDFTSQDCVSIMGSWNGLVALYRSPGHFCLFNPYMAGKEITVQVPMDEDAAWSEYNLYGLCHDSVNDEYLAIFSRKAFPALHNFYVVSFKNGSWNLKIQPETHDVFPWAAPGTIVKGIPYWICTRGDLDESIFYFDSKTEEFREAPKAPIDRKRMIRGLGGLDGQLTAAVSSDLGFEVWAMKENGNGDCCWNLLFVVANKLRSLSTLSWMMKEVEVLIDVNGEEVMIYNTKERRLRRIQRRMRRSLYNIVTYLPSLISPS